PTGWKEQLSPKARRSPGGRKHPVPSPGRRHLAHQEPASGQPRSDHGLCSAHSAAPESPAAVRPHGHHQDPRERGQRGAARNARVHVRGRGILTAGRTGNAGEQLQPRRAAPAYGRAPRKTQEAQALASVTFRCGAESTCADVARTARLELSRLPIIFLGRRRGQLFSSTASVCFA
ncbi:hypothetical protein IscW_ISCW010510, partial [Ixodes scapularis]